MSSALEVGQQFHRHEGFDSLRAGALLLGVVYHAALSFAHYPVLWFVNDGDSGVTIDALLFLVHSFRLPLFFLLGGYFASLLLNARGSKSFVRNRLKRIFVPLLLFYIVLMPVWAIVIGYVINHAANQTPVIKFIIAQKQAGGGRHGLSDIHLTHLWFLYFLLLFYGVYLLGWMLLSRVRGTKTPAEQGRPWWLSLAGVAVCVVCSVLAFTAIGSLSLINAPAPDSIVPPPWALLYYSSFFFTGVILRGWIAGASISRRASISALVIGCLILTPLNFLLIVVQSGGRPQTLAPGTGLVLTLSYILQGWLIVVGLTGLIASMTAGGNRVTRYLSDAAYWIYLSHPPLVIFLQVILQRVPGPAPLKFLFVFLVTMAVLLVIYHFLVRNTPLGRLLNGRRKGAGTQDGLTLQSSPPRTTEAT